jgi:hypothetical protein
MLTLVLYGQQEFGRTLYSVNSTQSSPVPVWIEIEQDSTGVWTEINQSFT